MIANFKWQKHMAAILLVICLLAGGAYARQFFVVAACKSAREAGHKSGDLRAAAEACRAPAEMGDLDAQLFTGEYYHQGGFIERDEKEAGKWFKLAEAGLKAQAEKGDGAAQYKLAYFYTTSMLRDGTRALDWARKAAAQGYRGAEGLIPQEPSVMWQTAVTPGLLEAARGGDLGAEYSLCMEYPRGLSPADTKKHRKVLEDALQWCQAFLKSSPHDPSAFLTPGTVAPPPDPNSDDMAAMAVTELTGMIKTADAESAKLVPPKPPAKPEVDLGELVYLCPGGLDYEHGGCLYVP